MPQTGAKLTIETLNDVSVMIDKGEVDKAKKVLEVALASPSSSHAEKQLKARALMLNARLLLLQDVPKALESCENALVLAKESLDRPLEAETLCVLGNIQWKLSDFSKSLKTLENALAIAKSLQDKRLEGIARIEKGTILTYKGQTGLAEREFREAILALEAGSDLPQMARAYNNLACVYTSENRFEKAVEFYGKSKRLAQRIGYQHMIAWGAYNLGDSYFELGKLKEAMAELEVALPIFKAMKDPRGLIAVNQILGLVSAKMGDWAKAEEYLSSALRYTQRNKSPVDEGKTCYRMGLMYKWRGDIEKARRYLQKALEIFEKYGIEEGKALAKKEFQEISK